MSFGFSIGDITTVVEFANKIRKQFVGAPSQLRKISDEVRGLSIVLQDAEVISAQCELGDKQLGKLDEITGSCHKVLLDLECVLNKYGDLHTKDQKLGSKVKRAWSRLEFEPEDIRELRARLTSNATILNTYIAQISSQETIAIRKAIVSLEHQQDDRDRRNILAWLSPVDYASEQTDFINQRQAGTGQWLLNSTEFQAWLQASNQTMFCPGIPGAGKTILASIVVDELTTRFRDNETVGIAYLYCNFRRAHEQNAADLVASLLKQLSQSRSTLPVSVRSLYDNDKKQPRRPSFDQLSQTLRSVAEEYQRVFVIVDALDECQTSDGCRQQFLKCMLTLVDQLGVNFFATSRNIPGIAQHFQGMAQLEIRARKEDVREYLNGHISGLPSFVGRNPALKEEIFTEIIKAVDGMFLLAKLHLDSLVGKRSPKAVRTALGKLPSRSDAYDHAYQNAMERIEGQLADQEELAKQVLAWVTCALRPLSTIDIQHALAVEFGLPGLDEENLPDPEDLLSVCAGLVTIDEKSHIIRLAHYTTQEYLNRTKGRWFPRAATLISSTCVTYLSYDVFASGICTSMDEYVERLSLYPLYSYAACNWGYHAREAPTCGQELTDFLMSEMKTEASGQVMFERELQFDFDRFGHKSRRMTGLHLSAFFAFDEGTKSLLSKGVEADLGDGEGLTALHWAALRGHNSIVNLLLDAGNADINASNNQGDTPLIAATLRGHRSTVKLLLDREQADVNWRCARGRTALSYAAGSDRADIVRLLLDSGKLELNLADNCGRTALAIAAGKGCDAAVEILLKEPTLDVDLPDQNETTPLAHAAVNGRDRIIHLMLESARADPNKSNSHGRTPLLWAAGLCDRESTMKILLKAGAVNAELATQDGRTPLSMAAGTGKLAAVKLLLDAANVDPNSRDNIKRTPLWHAAQEGQDEVVTALLSNASVEPDSRDHFGTSPLSISVRHGHMLVVEYLLATGRVEVGSSDQFGRTPLWYARALGSSKAARLLLEHAEQRGSSVCQNGLLTEVFPSHKGPHRMNMTCDICMFGLSAKQVWYHCQICNVDNFDICLECYSIGGRCLNPDHQLFERT
ncbi:ankyrin repeat-containing domain protein [Coniochaeta sp. 2T2.1]|nr:ankyrin repeat-containing domain protein [Coniochaeta sp. 2T2.1]